MTSRIFDRPKGSNSKSDSPILPTKNLSPRRSPGGVGFPRRYGRMAVLALVFLSAFAFFFYGFEKTGTVINSYRNPPLYGKYHAYEEQLPQHNPDLPYPEGRDAKFFWASNHVTHSGWGNAMQELVVNAHLAYVTKRSFVFDNYTWDRDGPEYSLYNDKLIPARIPLSTMITGPLIGAPFEPGDDAPRAVSKKYFDQICPKSKRVYIDAEEVNDDKIRYGENIGASYMFDRWVKKLNSIEEQCVEILQDSFQLFEIWLFGSRRILDIWPELSKSPILRDFGWSHLIRSAFKNNIRLFQPFSWWSFLFSSAEPMATPPDESDAPFPGLLVLHIRRGDFQDHCGHLAKWSSEWNGFNSFPSFPDKFSPPPGGGGGSTTPENTEIYMKHCFPTIQQIVDRVTEVKNASQGLKNVYIMTNGNLPWQGELKAALKKAHKWGQVTSSSDLKLNWEQRYVAQTVDMMIGQRAQVFIGNGFSSLTSNIVMLRMAKNVPPETNRFW